eukprot:760593-Hanusia_phi.AAC.4
MSDLQHFVPAEPLGEAKIYLSRLKKGLRIPILKKWPENAIKSPGVEGYFSENGPILIIEDCKWLRLNSGAVLENQWRYKTDLLKFRYWAIQDALEENNPADQDFLERTVGSGNSFEAGTIASHASGTWSFFDARNIS